MQSLLLAIIALYISKLQSGGGKTGDVKKGNQPILGNNITVFAGAKVLGKIIIQDNCIIGAQSVVLKDAPEKSVLAGVPAKQVNVRN